MPRGTSLLYLTRRVSFALASGEWGFRGASLVSLVFGSPNADFACRMWRSRNVSLNFASCLSWTIDCSSLQLTRTPPLSAFSVPVASWGLRETHDDLVLRKRVDWLDAREFDHAGLMRDVGACVTPGAIGHDVPHSSNLCERLRADFGAIPRRDPAVGAGLWALGAEKEELFILCLVEFDDERFDHLPLVEDVTLRHNLFVSNKSSPQWSRHLLYAWEDMSSCKISLNQLKNYNGLILQLQVREDVES